MNLLTIIQIEDATHHDLVATQRAINERLERLDSDAVLAVTRESLARSGVTDPLRITIGVEEWDNGYFYSGIGDVWNANGNLVILDDTTLFSLHEALEEPLGELSYTVAPVGRFATIHIDLANNTLRR